MRVCIGHNSWQARAAATAGTATEVADVARIAQKEVAMLQGQLADLDHKNKLAVKQTHSLPWMAESSQVHTRAA